MKTRNIITAFATAGVLAVASTGGAAEVQSVNAYYFGNSYLGNAMPGLHPLLGKSAGKEWNTRAAIKAGIPIWYHANQILTKGGEYKEFDENAAQTDALVMLIYGGHGLSHVSKGYWGTNFPEPFDVGDINASAYLIDEYLKRNPNGRAFIYTAWPGIPEVADVRKRVQDEMKLTMQNQGIDREAILKKVKERKPTHEEMEPLRKNFDYAKEWLTQDYIAESAPVERRARFETYAKTLKGDPKKPVAVPTSFAELAAACKVDVKLVAEDLASIRVKTEDLAKPATVERIRSFVNEWPHTHSRAHMWAVMEGLKKRFPQLWAEGRLGMIPVGDIFLELDKKMRAGKVPGIVNIGEYSADGGHLRAGLSRYTLAASFYAVLFGEHPGKLDWKIFNELSNYESKKFGGFYVHQPDLAVLLDITPERAKAVNDTIWEVVKNHPYTQVSK